MAIEPKAYNLDEDVKESFRFILKGYEYDFRQMTTEEIDKFQTLKEEKEQREFLFSFITPVDEKSPTFEEVSKRMYAKNWRNFLTMVTTEMGGNNG